MRALWDKLWNSSLIRFGIVGVINTLFGTTIMFVLYNVFQAGYWPAVFANYFFGSILSFLLNKYFTFRSKEWSLGEVRRFIINIVVCAGAAYGIARPLVRLLLSGQSPVIRDNAAMLTGMVLFVGLNYLGQRFFAFRKSGNSR